MMLIERSSMECHYEHTIPTRSIAQYSPRILLYVATMFCFHRDVPLKLVLCHGFKAKFLDSFAMYCGVSMLCTPHVRFRESQQRAPVGAFLDISTSKQRGT
eukprot:3945238-Amphidinium_carterae.1